VCDVNVLILRGIHNDGWCLVQQYNDVNALILMGIHNNDNHFAYKNQDANTLILRASVNKFYTKKLIKNWAV